MLNKEEIEIVERAIAARMPADIPIVKLEIADHLITDIEKIMEGDSAVNFYNALQAALRNYGGREMILKTLKSKSSQIHKQLIIRTVKSITWVEFFISSLLLLFLLGSGLSQEIKMPVLYLVAWLLVFFVAYKRSFFTVGKMSLLIDGMLAISILPYSAVSTCLYAINDFSTILTPTLNTITFAFTYAAVIYMLLRHRVSYRMMTEELEIVNKLKADYIT